jgi:lipopolysaccharide transport system permease protein
MSQVITERVLRPRRGFAGLNLGELWRFRELLWLLAWRDVLVRYKQTYLGVAWAVLQPVLTMVVFSVLFGRWVKLDSWGAPYPIMILAALLPWQFFANALTESSASLVASARIISKVYFPRLLVPLAAVLGGVVDVTIAVLILFILMPCYGLAFRPHLLLLPLFFAAAFLPAVAAGVWFSALNVKYRDVRYIVPFVTRIGMYVTPIGFLWQTVVPERWRLLLHGNPLVGVIDGFRWCILGGQSHLYLPGFLLSIVLTAVLLWIGVSAFRRLEKTFADLI